MRFREKISMTQILVSAIGRMELPLTDMGETVRGGGYCGVALGHVKLEMCARD